ncbi:murein biosynthesis integral membrane protein MurJ [Agitococcus lubricus]|uniref:Probable lipid II flippase MurJ n=1 Tax=Agitococcus lubricus TaxID=1077255 RepID=A0A2T5J2E9_9GAMM|nr:murein biosynthesis integral membrane protein MurJ [Agitococcus lubricus]PTQ90691.1 putative peptidoglycan lipid II flippase [Agitococcus lubricus]
MANSTPPVSDNTPQKVKSGLWRSTLVVSAMTMLSRIMGLVRDMVLMNTFGADKLMDAFLVAFKIPNFLRRLFAEGAFAQAFVPVLSEYKTQKGDDAVRELVSKTAGSLSLILLLISIVAVVAAPLIMWVFAPGFKDDPEKFNLAADMLRITFPYLLLISLTAFAGGILNSYGAFALSSFTPVLLNLIMIGSALFAAPYFDIPVMALAWGVLLAGVAQLAFQIPSLYNIGMLPRFRVDFADEGVKKIFTLMLPALFGVSVSQINLLLDTILASFLVSGSVSWLYTAERLTELPLGLIGIAVATVILPSLSAKHAEKSDTEFRAMLDWALRVIVLVGVPASLAMLILAEPMIAALFYHGKFSQHDVAMSAAALQALSGGILAFMLIKVFAPGYYARQDTKTPVKIGIIAMVSNMVFNLMLVWHFKHVGLALASTLSALLNAGLLYWGLHKKGVYRLERHWLALGGRYLVANTAMVSVLLFITPPLNYWLTADWLYKIGYLLVICMAGIVTYLLVLTLVGFKWRELRH